MQNFLLEVSQLNVLLCCFCCFLVQSMIMSEECETPVCAYAMTTTWSASLPGLELDSDALSTATAVTSASSRHLPRSITMTSAKKLQLQRKRFFDDGVPAFIACLWRTVHDARCIGGVCKWMPDQVLEICDRDAFMRVFRSSAPFEHDASWASFVHRSRDWGFANKTQRKPYHLKLFHRSGLFVQNSTPAMLACIRRRNSHRVQFHTYSESTASPKEIDM
jgi:hypothetical protein